MCTHNHSKQKLSADDYFTTQLMVIHLKINETFNFKTRKPSAVIMNILLFPTAYLKLLWWYLKSSKQNIKLR